MKTVHTYLLGGCLLLLFVLAATSLPAQEETDYYTISGMVRDRQTRRTLGNVSVSIPETPIGTISNADGTFSLKIRRDLGAREVEFSHVGYQRNRFPVSGKDQSGLVIELTEGNVLVGDVLVYNQDPLVLVEQALSRVGDNYTDKAAMLTGFYRETVQKRQQYIHISEAVVEVYSTSYTDGIEGERVQVLKGRNLVSTRAADTVGVKLLGGPNTYIFGDIVKNQDLVLNPQNLHYYRYRMENPSMIRERAQYVVAFEPQVTLEDEALYRGVLFIDRETLTISRAEYALDMYDRTKATRMILRKKPPTLRFTPDEVSYVANYREQNGRSYLYYINNTIRFRCDWRRKLFRTNYTVTAETVVTDARQENVSQIRFRDSFRQSQALSDRVSDFYDPNFWEAYNIIEPTESLESAVDRLRKQRE